MSGLSIVSVVGNARGAAGSSWSLAPTDRSFDVRVVLQGTGAVIVRLRVTRDGEHVHMDEQQHELDGGRLELTFPQVGEFRERGRYTLELEAFSADGSVRQKSTVSVNRS